MRVLVLLLLLVTAAAPAMAADDVPLAATGFPFSPEAPSPVPPDHPLHHRVTVASVVGMPSTIGASVLTAFIGAAKRSSFEKGLRETLGKLNMLAPSDAEAKFRLVPTWGGLDSPIRISFKTRATVRMSWRLLRVDSGKEIFQRDIATFAEAKGGDGSLRTIGVRRVALMANIASVARCLDMAAYGNAPRDCALTPLFTYQAPTPTFTTIFINSR